uniref:MobA/MobL protein domain-containing protein n=1 Tax=uncultured prokaryote TaxID=198431 RepID=A0A0H5Q2X9_9ZZZZ|nr:hypothetical protein [uncultured prokaryote]
MAIYHCSIKIIGRSSGRSAIGASAYRSGENLFDKETGITHDYTKKHGIEYKEIMLPPNAPREFKNRQTLWSEVQKIESASNAQLAREFEVAIPKELNFAQGRALVQNFCRDLVKEGMCIDLAIHDKGDGNRHAHIMATTRPIKENGQWATKEKKDYALDNHGQRIPLIDKETGLQKVDSKNRKQWKRITVEANNWNKKEKVEQWRENWASHCNKYLKAHNVQIDHRSYERQEIDKIPTIHEGYIAREMERNGKTSDRCELNREIKMLPQLEEEKNFLENLKEKIINSIGNIYERLRTFDLGRGADEQAREIERGELRAFINGERTPKKDREERERTPNIKQPTQSRASERNSNERRNDKKERQRDFGMGR